MPTKFSIIHIYSVSNDSPNIENTDFFDIPLKSAIDILCEDDTKNNLNLKHGKKSPKKSIKNQ